MMKIKIKNPYDSKDMLHESVLFLWAFCVMFKQEVHATH